MLSSGGGGDGIVCGSGTRVANVLPTCRDVPGASAVHAFLQDFFLLLQIAKVEMRL
jgi:hypothetical protein